VWVICTATAVQSDNTIKQGFLLLLLPNASKTLTASTTMIPNDHCCHARVEPYLPKSFINASPLRACDYVRFSISH